MYMVCVCILRICCNERDGFDLPVLIPAVSPATVVGCDGDGDEPRLVGDCVRPNVLALMSLVRFNARPDPTRRGEPRPSFSGKSFPS